MAPALPRLRACLITWAPAAAARSAVSSADPSSTTTTTSTPLRVLAARTVAPIWPASFQAGMMTATSPGGMVTDSNAAVSRAALLAGHLSWVVEHREHRLQARHLQDLPGRRAGPGQLQFAAMLTGMPMRGEEHVDAGRVTEVHARHVHDESRRARAQRTHQLGLQSGCGVQIDLTEHRDYGVIALRPSRDL